MNKLPMPRKMSILVALSFSFFFYQAQGQMAPDFMVTDSDGNAHQLYADYLNNGKTVMVKIFFTSCPPCIELAPFMEDFYQEWGAGENDVEFFELSDKSFDVDTRIINYKTTYGMTFPGVGSEGGSLEAVAPYKSGQFGNFTGTPTFVVIAPDGNVQFDIFGNGISGQFDALDAALLATGAMKPDTMVIDTMTIDTMTIDTMTVDTTTTTPVTLAGQISFGSGQQAIPNVIVEVLATIDPNGEVLFSDTSDMSGNISLSFFEDSVATDAVIRARKKDSAGNGLTGIDLVRIQRHLLNIEPFTEGLQYLLSDANQTGTISALDLVEIQKIILGIKPDFDDGVSWFFLPVNETIPLNGNQVPTDFKAYIQLSEVLDETTPLQFKAYKKGDLNGSANPNG